MITACLAEPEPGPSLPDSDPGVEPEQASSHCGNSVCETGEATTCPGDCPQEPACPSAIELGNDLAVDRGDPVPHATNSVIEPALAYHWVGPRDGRYQVIATAPVAITLDVRDGDCAGVVAAYGAPAATILVTTGEAFTITVDGLVEAGDRVSLQIQRVPDVCGDGICGGDEDTASCAVDCPPPPVCGDGTCSGDETCDSCPTDCGECPAPPPVECGDGTCSAGEDCNSCAVDCGVCA
jgi:hypothetical protein